MHVTEESKKSQTAAIEGSERKTATSDARGPKKVGGGAFGTRPRMHQHAEEIKGEFDYREKSPPPVPPSSHRRAKKKKKSNARTKRANLKKEHDGQGRRPKLSNKTILHLLEGKSFLIRDHRGGRQEKGLDL